MAAFGATSAATQPVRQSAKPDLVAGVLPTLQPTIFLTSSILVTPRLRFKQSRRPATRRSASATRARPVIPMMTEMMTEAILASARLGYFLLQNPTRSMRGMTSSPFFRTNHTQLCADTGEQVKSKVVSRSVAADVLLDRSQT